MREGQGNAERGFTLIELMAVVAIIAVLAAVVVPTWMRESNKSKRKTEVTAMFAEIGSKQEQFKIDQGKYMGDITATDYVGSTSCPATVPTADYNFMSTSGCIAAGTAFAALRVDATSSALRCQYTISAGTAADVLTPPTGFKNSQNATGPEPTLATGWWYVLATCDEGGNGGTNATYYMSSVDRKLQALNEGS